MKQNEQKNQIQEIQQPNQPTNIQERLLDIESLLLLLESDPDLQSHHQRIFRIIHNLIKELLNLLVE